MLRRILSFTALSALILVTHARAQCPRAWLPAPNGVYDAPTGSSEVLAMTEWDPDGAGPLPPVLVVGGNFIAAGDQGADYVAYWDGSAWHRLGWGFNAPVRALAVLNGVLYAGGDFTSTGGVAAHYFAYWTGSAWQEAGFGTDGPVYALAANGPELVVGGNFAHVAGGLIAAQFIARFSPGNWNLYGGPTPLPARVSALVIFAAEPVVLCDQADVSNPPRYDHVLYRWIGTQWAIVDYLNYAGGMGVSGSSLFYSTLIIDYAGSPCPHSSEYGIKRFDGGSTSVSYIYHSAASFVNLSGQLYALGFSRVICGGGFEQPWLGSWNGSQWADSTLGPGLYGGLLGAANGALYVGGALDHVYNGNQPVQVTNIAQLAGSQWTAMVDRLDAPVLCTGNASSYIGGAFVSEGDNVLSHGAYWNGQVWQSLGAFNGSVTSMFFYRPFNVSINPDFVASGPFTQLGTTPLNHIGIRDTSNNWTNMGTGIDAPAFAMISVPAGGGRNDLIAGGQFITAGGVTTNHIARWGSAASAWSALGAGTNGQVNALAYFGGQIIAGGSFGSAGGVGAANIASWNGTAWSPLGSGVNAAVRALLVYNGQLVVGGDFTAAGGSAAAHLAAWDGSAWTPFNGGADGSVYAMVISGADLIVGGVFTHVSSGATPANNIADWDGALWNPVGGFDGNPGGGMDGPVFTLSLSGTTLVAGGSFTHAGPELCPFAAMAVFPGTLSVIQQPADAAACQRAHASFSFQVGGWFTGISYAWRHNGITIDDGVNASGSVYAGTHAVTLSIDNTQYADAGGYSCVATSACNQTSTSTTAQLTVGVGCCGSADFNGDGAVATDADIEAFFACLAGNCCNTCGSADFNGDGAVATDADIEAFFRVLAGGSC
jgi:hypothetical protein